MAKMPTKIKAPSVVPDKTKSKPTAPPKGKPIKDPKMVSKNPYTRLGG